MELCHKTGPGERQRPRSHMWHVLNQFWEIPLHICFLTMQSMIGTSQQREHSTFYSRPKVLMTWWSKEWGLCDTLWNVFVKRQSEGKGYYLCVSGIFCETSSHIFPPVSILFLNIHLSVALVPKTLSRQGTPWNQKLLGDKHFHYFFFLAVIDENLSLQKGKVI